MKNIENQINIDEMLLNEALCDFIEEKLKYIPQSDFIYNKKLPVNLETLEKEKMVSLIKQLYVDHYKVCKENEQFRTQNFKQYIQLKKLGV